jgi:predicted MFS family arabinose efflux permease
MAIAVTIPGFLLFAMALRRVVPGRRVTATHTEQASTDGGTETRDTLAAVTDAVRSRRVALAVLAATLMLFVFQGLTAFLTTYLVDAKGLSEGTAGLLFGLLFVSGAVWQSVGGGLADRFGHGPVLAVVAFSGAIPLVALPFVSSTLALAGVAVFLGVRLSMGPISNAYVVSLLPPAVRGTAWGLLRTGFFTVGAFGSTAVGAMADRALFAEAFVLLAALSALAGVVYLFLPSREGHDSATAGATDGS